MLSIMEELGLAALDDRAHFEVCLRHSGHSCFPSEERLHLSFEFAKGTGDPGDEGSVFLAAT